MARVAALGLLHCGVVRTSKGPVPQPEQALDLGGRYWDRTSDLLGVNDLHGGRCRSFMQVEGLSRSHAVGTGRHGCCISPLYAQPGQLGVLVSSPLRDHGGWARLGPHQATFAPLGDPCLLRLLPFRRLRRTR